MLFKETNEVIVGHLHSLILVVDVVEASFDKFLWSATSSGSTHSSFLCILKTTNLKIRL